MQYRGIRYTLRIGIKAGEWGVAIHPPDDQVLETMLHGSHKAAALKARSMIDRWLRSDVAQGDKVTT
jgi:hypothetical protein